MGTFIRSSSRPRRQAGFAPAVRAVGSCNHRFVLAHLSPVWRAAVQRGVRPEGDGALGEAAHPQDPGLARPTWEPGARTPTPRARAGRITPRAIPCPISARARAITPYILCVCVAPLLTPTLSSHEQQQQQQQQQQQAGAPAAMEAMEDAVVKQERDEVEMELEALRIRHAGRAARGEAPGRRAPRPRPWTSPTSTSTTSSRAFPPCRSARTAPPARIAHGGGALARPVRRGHCRRPAVERRACEGRGIRLVRAIGRVWPSEPHHGVRPEAGRRGPAASLGHGRRVGTRAALRALSRPRRTLPHAASSRTLRPVRAGSARGQPRHAGAARSDRGRHAHDAQATAAAGVPQPGRATAAGQHQDRIAEIGSLVLTTLARSRARA